MIAALVFIVQAVSTLVLIAFMLRFLLPLFRADFHNPIAQAILKVTSPLVIPVRRILPSIGKLDTATIVVCFAIKYLEILIISFMTGVRPGPMFIAIAALFGLAMLAVNIVMFAIIIGIVISWIAPGTHNPRPALVHTISEPVIRPFRRLIPPIGAIDISPIVPLILLGALRVLLAQWPSLLM